MTISAQRVERQFWTFLDSIILKKLLKIVTKGSPWDGKVPKFVNFSIRKYRLKDWKLPTDVSNTSYQFRILDINRLIYYIIFSAFKTTRVPEYAHCGFVTQCIHEFDDHTHWAYDFDASDSN